MKLRNNTKKEEIKQGDADLKRDYEVNETVAKEEEVQKNG